MPPRSCSRLARRPSSGASSTTGRETDSAPSSSGARSRPTATSTPAAQQRIVAVEDEYQKLVTRYEQRGRYFERKGRLAEAILSFRVVIKLAPGDAETLAHVQDLSRQLASRKAELDAGFRSALQQGRLADAQASVEELRRLDPFDPAAENGERAVDEALGAEVERLLAAGRRGFTSGDYPHASEQFRAVLALEPENESAQGYLAYIDLVRESERTRPPVLAAGQRQDRRAQRSRPSFERRTARFAPRASIGMLWRPRALATATPQSATICVRSRRARATRGRGSTWPSSGRSSRRMCRG